MFRKIPLGIIILLALFPLNIQAEGSFGFYPTVDLNIWDVKITDMTNQEVAWFSNQNALPSFSGSFVGDTETDIIGGRLTFDIGTYKINQQKWEKKKEGVYRFRDFDSYAVGQYYFFIPTAYFKVSNIKFGGGVGRGIFSLDALGYYGPKGQNPPATTKREIHLGNNLLDFFNTKAYTFYYEASVPNFSNTIEITRMTVDKGTRKYEFMVWKLSYIFTF